MDNRTGKHSAKGMKTDAQRTTANIHVAELRNFFFLMYSFFFLSPKNGKD
jgi:hypothetical protein